MFPKLINKNRKDFKLTWKKIWSDDEDFFSRKFKIFPIHFFLKKKQRKINFEIEKKKWLDTSEGDKQIVRELAPASSADAEASASPMQAYRITTYTSDISGYVTT